MTLAAITIRQPWAHAITVGAKTIENRGRGTRHRGTIAIHASKTPSPAGDTDERILRLLGDNPRLGAPVGAVVAIAQLVDCHPAHPIWPTCCQPWGDSTYLHGGHDVQAWHLVLADVVPLPEPVPCRGEVRVPYDLPPDVAAAVRAQVRSETQP